MTAPLRVLLVDDERSARKWLRDLLSAHPEITIIGEADGIASAAELASRDSPDVIFLDIQMPPASGFDLLPLLHPIPRIVFVTAHDAYAVRAFEANALDYLLKPVSPERLAETLRRLQPDQDSRPRTEPAPPRLDPEDYIPLRDRGRLRMVKVGDIAAVEAETAYSRIWLLRRPPMMVLQRIGAWQRLLPEPPFVRIGRSLLLNMEAVRFVERPCRNETRIFLEGNPNPLCVGRSASVRLWRLLPGYPAAGRRREAG